MSMASPESTAPARSQPLPEELLQTLRDAAAVNSNYEPTRISASVRRDITAALIGEDGEMLSEAERKRNVEILCEAIRARVAQASDRTNILWKDRTRGSTVEEMRASPRRLLKSAGEALTHPADRIAGSRGGKAELDMQDTLLPQHIVIDPLRLSDRLVTNLGFGSMLAEKGSSRLEKLRAKIQIIPHIKEEVLRFLEPIPLSPASEKRKNYRLFRIAEGPRKGFILGVQEIAGDDRMFLTTIYGAKRRVDHIEEQYVKEQAQLARIKNKLDEVDQLLTQDWPGVKVPRRMRALLATLHGLVEELQFVFDGDKRKLHDNIEKAAEFLAKKNKGAALACINRLGRNRLIGGRQQEIPQIFGELAKDKLMVQAHINEEEAALESLYVEVKEQQSEPRIADPEVHIDVAVRNRISRMLIQNQSLIKFQPGLAFGEKLGNYLTAALAQLNTPGHEPDRKILAETFVRAFVVSKLSRFFHFLLALYEVFSVHGMHGVSVPDWQKELHEASQELNERGIGRKIYTNEFNGLWMNLRGLTAELKGAMDEYGRTRSQKKREEAIAKIKKLISDFDLPAQLQAIK